MQRINVCQSETELDRVIDSLVPEEELLLAALKRRCEILDRDSEARAVQEADANVSFLIDRIILCVV